MQNAVKSFCPRDNNYFRSWNQSRKNYVNFNRQSVNKPESLIYYTKRDNCNRTGYYISGLANDNGKKEIQQLENELVAIHKFKTRTILY